MNAIKVYDHLGSFNPFSPESFLEAHAMLMEDLVEKPGKYRSQGVGVFKGSELVHLAPPARNVYSLMQDLLGYPVFEFVPFESLIKQTQEDYYKVLVGCDKDGKSNAFIEYMLGVLDRALAELLDFNNRILNDSARLEYFAATGTLEFSRKDYMNVFKNISTATASRDLKKGTDENLLERKGLKNKTKYKVKTA